MQGNLERRIQLRDIETPICATHIDTGGEHGGGDQDKMWHLERRIQLRYI